MSIVVNLGRMSLSKASAVSTINEKGFLKFLAGELKKLAAVSNLAKGKSSEEDECSALISGVAEPGEEARAVATQFAQLQDVSRFVVPLPGLSEVRSSAGAASNAAIEDGATAERRSEEAILDGEAKTGLELRTAVARGVQPAISPTESVAGNLKCGLPEEISVSGAKERGQFTAPKQLEVEGGRSVERGSRDNKASQEQEHFQAVVERLKDSGVHFDYLRAAVEFAGSEGNQGQRASVESSACSPDFNAAYANEPIVKEHKVTGRSDLAEMATFATEKDNSQVSRAQRVVTVKDEISASRTAKTVGGGFAKVGLSTRLQPDTSSDSNGASGGPESPIATNQVLAEPSQVPPDSILADVLPEQLVTGAAGRERVMKGATAPDVLTKRTRFVPRTDEDGANAVPQRKSLIGAPRREQQSQAVNASQWPSPKNADQKSVITDDQRTPVQHSHRDEVDPLRIALHQPTSTNGHLAEWETAADELKPGESLVRDGAQLATPSGHPVHGARLLEQKEHAEMHIGLHTPETGRVEVHTVLRAGQTETIIAVEKSSVREALLSEVPALHFGVREHSPDMGRVTVVESGTMANFGGGQSGGGNGHSLERRFATNPVLVGTDSTEGSNEFEQMTADGLSIHV